MTRHQKVQTQNMSYTEIVMSTSYCPVLVSVQVRL